MHSASNDYFSNHSKKLKFPWSLYHKPIVSALKGTLATLQPGDILNVGSGPFAELEYLPDKHRYYACDLDPRAVSAAKERFGDRIRGYDVVAPDSDLPYESEQFDVVFSCDVIEHVVDGASWLRRIGRVLKPSGILLLTTPNYGLSTLPILEYTVLEFFARRQGFSRRDIHPSRYHGTKLKRLLEDTGFRNTSIQKIALGWVLFSSSSKR